MTVSVTAKGVSPVRHLPLAILLLPVLGSSPSLAGAPDVAFRVIVHPDVSASHVPREVLSSIFLKEQDRWEDGQTVAPVDQSLRSTVRAAFSKEVLEEPVVAVEALWRTRIGQGVTPPRVKGSDDEVIAYVAQTKGAVGYVSADLSLPPTVKILSVLY
jgi:hypothetical protein